MLVVHHLNNSRSQRVLWLLEELGVPYEITALRARRGDDAGAGVARAIHPLGKSPVIRDGDVTLAESGAILEYLVERYGKGRLVPARRHAGAPALQLLDALRRGLADASAALQARLRPRRERRRCRSSCGRSRGDRGARAQATFIEPQLKLHLDFLERELGEAPLVHRQRLHRRRHPDELPARGRRRARGTRRAPAAARRSFSSACRRGRRTSARSSAAARTS